MHAMLVTAALAFVLVFIPTFAYLMLVAVSIFSMAVFIGVILHLCGRSFFLDKLCDAMHFIQHNIPKAKARCVAIQAVLQTQFRK